MFHEDEWTVMDIFASPSPPVARILGVQPECLWPTAPPSTVTVVLPFELIPGEIIKFCKHDVRHQYKCSPASTQILGTLYGTNYRLVFCPKVTPTVGLATCLANKQLHLPLNTLSVCETVTVSTGVYALYQHYNQQPQQPPFLEFTSKQHLIAHQIYFPDTQSRDSVSNQLYGSLTSASRLFGCFAFANREDDPVPGGIRKGWGLYNAEVEYRRIGLLKGGAWRLSDVNKQYKMCCSYPQKLLVPSSITDEELLACSMFRTNKRIPLVVWQDPANGATIARSSQPMVGMLRARGLADEKLVKAIFDNNTKCGYQSMVIVDCRPKLSAVANAAKGAGYENVNNYSSCKIKFMNIDNIHAMRESYRSMKELCGKHDNKNAAGQWLSSLDATRWLHHLALVIGACERIVRAVHVKGSSVLIHCSDGWDRTAQLSSLSQLMLDSYYRTIDGFQLLIEKEWIAFGHKFATRCGHWMQEQGDEISPIFLQWIDCVYQLTVQYPCSFEWNEDFLSFVLDQSYSCRFGDFLFDSEMERSQHHLNRRSPSIWAYIGEHKDRFLNPYYKAPSTFERSEAGSSASPARDPEVLMVGSNPAQLRFWSGYYLATNPEVNHIERCQKEKETIVRGMMQEMLALKMQLGALAQENAGLRQNMLWTRLADDCGSSRIAYKVVGKDAAPFTFINPELHNVIIIDDYEPNSARSRDCK